MAFKSKLPSIMHCDEQFNKNSELLFFFTPKQFFPREYPIFFLNFAKELEYKQSVCCYWKEPLGLVACGEGKSPAGDQEGKPVFNVEARNG